jgi:adenosylhomocysteine nucleosidase
VTLGEPVKRVAFLAPMPSEIRPLVKTLGLRRRSAAPGGSPQDAIYEGRHGPVDVIATISGVGTAAATQAAHRLLDDGDVDHLLVIGVAGGIADGIHVGDVVVPEIVLDAASGREHRSTPLGRTEAFGRLYTSDEFIKDIDRLGGFRDQGVTAIDMETSAVAAVCAERNVPWSVFRGISDDAFDQNIDAAVFLLAKPDGSPDMRRVVRYVVTRPSRIAMLTRLARGLNAATRGAVDAALRSVSEHTGG